MSKPFVWLSTTWAQWAIGNRLDGIYVSSALRPPNFAKKTSVLEGLVVGVQGGLWRRHTGPMRWDDLELLKVIDDLEQQGNITYLNNGMDLMRHIGGQTIDWSRDTAPFARELVLAHQAGYLEWTDLTGRNRGGGGDPRNDPTNWLQEILQIRLTVPGRDRARGRVIVAPFPDPDEDDDRLITGMTLEEIARALADVYTEGQLPRYLRDSGVPEEFLATGPSQSKWEYVMTVLERLLDGGSAARRCLRDFIGGWLDGRHHAPPRPAIRKRITAFLAQEGWHVRDGRLVIGDRTFDSAGVLTPLGRDVRVAALHQEVRQVADRYIEGERMEAAIFEAFKAVNNRVKAMSKLDMDGASLMSHAFSDDKPRIILADLSTQSGRDLQKGFRLIFMGAVQGIRNPDAHEQFKPLGPEEGLEELAFASMLMRRLDDATPVAPG